jgi:hypothetical protein
VSERCTLWKLSRGARRRRACNQESSLRLSMTGGGGQNRTAGSAVFILYEGRGTSWTIPATFSRDTTWSLRKASGRNERRIGRGHLHAIRHISHTSHTHLQGHRGQTRSTPSHPHMRAASTLATRKSIRASLHSTHYDQVHSGTNRVRSNQKNRFRTCLLLL